MTAQEKYGLKCCDGAMINDPALAWWRCEHSPGCPDQWQPNLGTGWQQAPEPWTESDQAGLLAEIASGTLATPLALRTRQCSKCGETRSLAEFARERRGYGGRKRQCRACRRTAGDGQALRSRRSRRHKRG
jgi:hypothetical protein